jgi:hypothetical protein
VVDALVLAALEQIAGRLVERPDQTRARTPVEPDLDLVDAASPPGRPVLVVWTPYDAVAS